MDELYKYGLTQLFLELAIALTKTFQIEVNFNHADITSFHLHGKYDYNYGELANPSEGLIRACCTRSKPLAINALSRIDS